MSRCGGCLCVVVSVTVLALCSTLLMRGVVIKPDAEALALLDGGEFQSVAELTTGYGAVSLLIWVLLLGGLLCRSWKVLLVAWVLLLGVFMSVRYETAGRAAGDQLNDIAAAMHSSLADYNDDPAVARAWRLVQHGLHCCGVYDSTNWAPQLGLGHVPPSCCDDIGGSAAAYCSAPVAYPQGCAPAVQRFVESERTWSVAVATAAASLLLVLLVDGVLGACCQSVGGGESSGGHSALPRMSKAALDNRANQLNPNNWRYQGRRAFRQMSQAELDNRANKLNPNNWRYQGRR